MTTPSRTGFNQLDASGGNLSTSATIPANTNLAVAFWSHWDNNGGSIANSLAINSVSMTIASQLAEGATTDESGVGVAYLVNPGTGSLTHALTWSAGGARAEGGEVVFVYYQDGNTSDPVRAAGTNAAVSTTNPTVELANTASTDMVVGFTQSFSLGTPAITGVTAFIDNATLNGHDYDVGEATGLTGTVTIGNSGGILAAYFSSTAAISLKASVAGGGQTVAINQVTETDLAQTFGRLKTHALAQASETDAAQAFGRKKAKSFGQATENDAAQSLGRGKLRLLVQVSEADLAQAFARIKARALGQAAEAGTAQALTRRKAKALDQPAESGTSQAIARRKAKAVGQPLEASTAQAVKLSGPIIVALGTALEVESAHAITNLIPFVAPAGGATRRQHLRFRRNGEVVLLTKKPVRSGAGRISASAGAETVLRARPLSSSAGKAFPQGSGEVSVRGLPPARASTRSRIRGYAGAEVVLRNRRRARVLAGRVTAVGFDNPSQSELMVLALNLSWQRRQARVRRILEALGVDA